MNLHREGVLDVLRKTFPELSDDELSNMTAGEAPWDSLGHLRFVMELEMASGISVPAEKFGELTSIENVVDFFSALDSRV